MLVGVPREIKDNEYRVGIVPSTVRELTENGHQVLVESQAGAGAEFGDSDYKSAGAEIVPDGDAVFGRAKLIVKVKEPLAAERKKLSRGQVLFTYLHLAPDRVQTEELMASGVTAIAYETVTSQQGTLPLLMPMSEIAGRMAPQVGAHYLEKQNGGRGVLLTGAPGVAAASVIILGGGVAGTNAAQIASGMGADVTVLDRNPEALRRIATQLGGRVRTLFSTRDVVELLCRRADLVIATVLVPGATAPKLISAQTVKAMKPGTVIVDVAIDQGGCAETSRPTTHSHPTFVVDNVVHYCVTNMPGAVPRSSTFALRPMQQHHLSSRSPTRDGGGRSTMTRICGMVSMCTMARSPVVPLPMRSSCLTRQPIRHCRSPPMRSSNNAQSLPQCRMSAYGTKWTSNCRPPMSAFGGKADMMRTCCLDIGVNGQELLGKAQTVEIKERLLPQQQRWDERCTQGVIDTAVSWHVVRNMVL